jgi:hypothetical protein
MSVALPYALKRLAIRYGIAPAVVFLLYFAWKFYENFQNSRDIYQQRIIDEMAATEPPPSTASRSTMITSATDAEYLTISWTRTRFISVPAEEKKEKEPIIHLTEQELSEKKLN